MPLPDGTGDAVSFEAMAWDYAVHGPYTGSQTVPGHHILGSCVYSGLIRSQCHFWLHYSGPNSDFFPWLMSLVYLITGRSFLLLQSISVFVGVLSVYATWLLGSEVWGERAGRRAAWVMALFPTVVMYSALPLREAYLVCLLMFGLVWVARWSREGKVRQAIWAFVLFGVAIFFHGSAFLVAFGFMMVITSKIFWRGGQSFIRGRLHLTALVGLVVVGGSILFWGLSGTYVDKLGRLTDIVDLERWVSYSQAKYYADGHEANAVYPEWTAPKSTEDLVWAIPVKITYLLFSPFPWDIKTPAHL
ncbi:MAG: glycosyltransferase family 39 protein, partial [Anaerolineales bacterium]|nr:glycosyltransferase family 39 protein [Anaerolineales bacterium]